MATIRRGDTDLSLVVAVNKPPALTSHDVVGCVRRIFGERRVGHAGTLDPFATGVLPVMIGPATKLMQYFSGLSKTYIATIKFGSSTDTHDCEGQVTSTSEVPDELRSQKYASEILSGFVGPQMQTPPLYSAIKLGGKRAYELARNGKVTELTAREIEIYSANLLNIDTDASDDALLWNVQFKVSSGTYIRSIARDIAERCGCAAHLARLVRMRVGTIDIVQSRTLDNLLEAKESAAIDPATIFDFSIAFASEKQTSLIKNGVSIPIDDFILCKYSDESYVPLVDGEKPSKFVTMANSQEILGIYRTDMSSGMLRAESVFSKGISRGKSDC